MPTVSGPIRVTIPAKVAANIKTLKSTLESIADRTVFELRESKFQQ